MFQNTEYGRHIPPELGEFYYLDAALTAESCCIFMWKPIPRKPLSLPATLRPLAGTYNLHMRGQILILLSRIYHSVQENQNQSISP